DSSSVEVRGDHNRILGNFFKNGRRTDAVKAAVRIQGGSYNRVAYNEIGPWKTYGIRVLPRGGRPTGNLIDHNYIHDMTGERRNGSEAIQLGSSREHTTFEMNTIIEY